MRDNLVPDSLVRTVWCGDNLVPDSLVRGQFGAGQFGAGQFGAGQLGATDNMVPDNLVPDNSVRRTIWCLDVAAKEHGDISIYLYFLFRQKPKNGMLFIHVAIVQFAIAAEITF